MFTDLVAALRAYCMCLKRPSKTCRGHVVVSGWEFVKYCCFGKICPGAFCLWTPEVNMDGRICTSDVPFATKKEKKKKRLRLSASIQ